MEGAAGIIGWMDVLVNDSDHSNEVQHETLVTIVDPRKWQSNGVVIHFDHPITDEGTRMCSPLIMPYRSANRSAIVLFPLPVGPKRTTRGVTGAALRSAVPKKDSTTIRVGGGGGKGGRGCGMMHWCNVKESH